MAITTQRKVSKHKCEICLLPLNYHYDDETDQWSRHWVESGITGNKYCWPGEGCFVSIATNTEAIENFVEILDGNPLFDPPEYDGHFPLEHTEDIEAIKARYRKPQGKRV